MRTGFISLRYGPRAHSHCAPVGPADSTPGHLGLESPGTSPGLPVPPGVPPSATSAILDEGAAIKVFVGESVAATLSTVKFGHGSKVAAS